MPSLLGQVERVPLGKLGHYPGNPRRGNVKAIAGSLHANGQYAPIVVQRSTSYVLAGNHTLMAARSLGWPDVDVVYVDVDDTAARKIVLSSNRTADFGRYDDTALADLLAALDGDYDGTCWEPENLTPLTTPAPYTEPPPDLDQLVADLGPPSEDDGWPSVRVRAPRVVIARWGEHVQACGGDEAVAFARLLGMELLG